MISAFGERAQRFAHGLGDIDAVIADPELIGQAYLEAVRRRERGAAFYGMILTDDPRVLLGYRVGSQITAAVADYDRCRGSFDMLRDGSLVVDNQRADTFWRGDETAQCISTEFLSLCDAMLVRSFEELHRINRWFANPVVSRALRPVERVVSEADVPVVERVRPDRPTVVLWAPYRPAHECALALFGLAEIRGDILCVSAGGALPKTFGAVVVEPNDPRVAAALARAACIVCLEPSDPSDAVAFARAGYGIVAPFTAGAHEFSGDVVPWDAADARFLHTAVSIALTRPASVNSDVARRPRKLAAPPRPAFVETLPLVSVITPTFNRRDDLRRMLTCLAAQTYTNIEALIVNDAGEAVDDIVSGFPFARLLNQTHNTGAIVAMENGLPHLRGEYLQILPDDDWLYPDHIDRLMNAIFRSGASIAHGSGLLRYLERVPGSDAWKTIGFNASTFRATTNYSDSLVTTPVGGHQMIVRRTIYDEIGWFLHGNAVADNEIQTRLAERYQFAYVDQTTTEFRDHAGGQGRAADFPSAMSWVYEHAHPVPDRPVIEYIRKATIENVASRPAGQSPFPATLRIG
jgi:glycosyltransferase involved in cell wall biosynthesis